MKADFVQIAIVLDRSGSMANVREATVMGFNAFLAEQRKEAGELRVRLVQFDDVIEQVYDKPLAEVPEMTQDTFVPRGGTALFDAQGETIGRLGADLAAMREDERPSRVIVMTLTDGAENASRQYTLAAVASLIAQQQRDYGWEFVFLGANQDAVLTAGTMNIPGASSMTYAASPMAMGRTMRAAAEVVGSARRGEKPLFSNRQREEAMDRQA